MCLYALQLYLLNDFTGQAASSVQANNSDLWPNVSLVPSYAYLPLSKIWLGLTAPMASSAMSGRIVYELGMGQENSRGEITLYATEVESARSPEYGLESNYPGAMSMTLDIWFRLPEETNNWNLMINAEYRVRWLLDQTWRKNRSRTPSWVPNLGDPTTAGEVLCVWQRIVSPPNARELISRYLVCFNAAVPQ